MSGTNGDYLVMFIYAPCQDPAGVAVHKCYVREPDPNKMPAISPANVEKWMKTCDEGLVYTGWIVDLNTAHVEPIGRWSKHKPEFVVRRECKPPE